MRDKFLKGTLPCCDKSLLQNSNTVVTGKQTTSTATRLGKIKWRLSQTVKLSRCRQRTSPISAGSAVCWKHTV